MSSSAAKRSRKRQKASVLRLDFTHCLILLLFLCCVGVVQRAAAHQRFQAKIPNGAAVLRNGNAWPAVGHDDGTNGGQPLNQFGRDFSTAGEAWTVTLCEKDSDGDGYTNGEELGDPDCLWSASGGSPPTRTTDISHPGFDDSTPTGGSSGGDPASTAPEATTPGAADSTAAATGDSADPTAEPPQTSADGGDTNTEPPASTSVAAPDPTTDSPAPTPRPPVPTGPHPQQPANNNGIIVDQGLVMYCFVLADPHSTDAERTIVLSLANGVNWNATYCRSARITFFPQDQNAIDNGMVNYLGQMILNDSVNCTGKYLSLLLHPLEELRLSFNEVLRMKFVGSFADGPEPPSAHFDILFVGNVAPTTAVPATPEPTPVPEPTTSAAPTPVPPPTPAPTPVPLAEHVGEPLEEPDPTIDDYFGIGRVMRDILIASGVTLMAILLPVTHWCCQRDRKTLKVGGRVGSWQEVYSGKFKRNITDEAYLASLREAEGESAAAAEEEEEDKKNGKKGGKGKKGKKKGDPKDDKKSSKVKKKKGEGEDAEEATNKEEAALFKKETEEFGIEEAKRRREKREEAKELAKFLAAGGIDMGPFDDPTWRMRSQWIYAHSGMRKVKEFDRNNHLRSVPPKVEFLFEVDAPFSPTTPIDNRQNLNDNKAAATISDKKASLLPQIEKQQRDHDIINPDDEAMANNGANNGGSGGGGGGEEQAEHLLKEHQERSQLMQDLYDNEAAGSRSPDKHGGNLRKSDSDGIMLDVPLLDLDTLVPPPPPPPPGEEDPHSHHNSSQMRRSRHQSGGKHHWNSTYGVLPGETFVGASGSRAHSAAGSPPRTNNPLSSSQNGRSNKSRRPMTEEEEYLFGDDGGMSANDSMKQLRQKEQQRRRVKVGPGGIAQVSRDWKPRARRGVRNVSTSRLEYSDEDHEMSPLSTQRTSKTSPHKRYSTSQQRRSGGSAGAYDHLPWNQRQQEEELENDLLDSGKLSWNPFDRPGRRLDPHHRRPPPVSMAKPPPPPQYAAAHGPIHQPYPHASLFVDDDDL